MSNDLHSKSLMLLNSITHLQISIDKVSKDPEGILNREKASVDALTAAPYHAAIVVKAARERLAQMEEEYKNLLIMEGTGK